MLLGYAPAIGLRDLRWGMADLSNAAMIDVADAAQRREGRGHTPGEAAIWVFILGDMVMFAAFFGQFAWDRIGQVDLFARSQRELNIVFGAVNTLLLLTGSLFVVLGVEAVKKCSGRGRRYFACALVCALAFGVDKVIEYSGKLGAGIGPDTNVFFNYY